jgi:hypothetical protein
MRKRIQLIEENKKTDIKILPIIFQFNKYISELKVSCLNHSEQIEVNFVAYFFEKPHFSFSKSFLDKVFETFETINAFQKYLIQRKDIQINSLYHFKFLGVIQIHQILTISLL